MVPSLVYDNSSALLWPWKDQVRKISFLLRRSRQGWGWSLREGCHAEPQTHLLPGLHDWHHSSSQACFLIQQWRLTLSDCCQNQMTVFCRFKMPLVIKWTMISSGTHKEAHKQWHTIDHKMHPDFRAGKLWKMVYHKVSDIGFQKIRMQSASLTGQPAYSVMDQLFVSPEKVGERSLTHGRVWGYSPWLCMGQV